MEKYIHCYYRVNEATKEKAIKEFKMYTDTKKFDDLEIRYLKKISKRWWKKNGLESECCKFKKGYYIFSKTKGLFGVPVWYSYYYKKENVK